MEGLALGKASKRHVHRRPASAHRDNSNLQRSMTPSKSYPNLADRLRGSLRGRNIAHLADGSTRRHKEGECNKEHLPVSDHREGHSSRQACRKWVKRRRCHWPAKIWLCESDDLNSSFERPIIFNTMPCVYLVDSESSGSCDQKANSGIECVFFATKPHPTTP